MKSKTISKLFRMIVFLLVLLLGSASIQAQTEPWTLKRSVEHALENNIQIRQAYLSTLDAKAAKCEAIGGF